MNDFGRHVLGAAAIALGAIALAWHDFNTWEQLRDLWSLPFGPVLLCCAAVAEIAGGLALQWRGRARAGAVALGAVYLFFALRWVASIVRAPRVYDHWGNFFEQFSLVCGALLIYASRARTLPRAARILRLTVILYGLCVISFTLEQLLYLRDTAGFVPAWLPPGQMFWAVATTIALALAVPAKGPAQMVHPQGLSSVAGAVTMSLARTPVPAPCPAPPRAPYPAVGVCRTPPTVAPPTAAGMFCHSRAPAGIPPAIAAPLKSVDTRLGVVVDARS